MIPPNKTRNMYKICSFGETLVSKAQHEIEVGACGEVGKRPEYTSLLLTWRCLVFAGQFLKL